MSAAQGSEFHAQNNKGNIRPVQTNLCVDEKQDSKNIFNPFWMQVSIIVGNQHPGATKQ
ncbi:MAG TPA: hypothetical protein VHM90_09670 [Phycisphaerae bacterium]|nr:hypothetical protein [Phycisphaerae bacterium]